RDVAQRVEEHLPGAREEMLPERPAAADEILPHPRLRLVDAERHRIAQRRAEMLVGQSLIVDAVARLVQNAEKGVVEMPGVVAGGNPTIAGAETATERMRRHIQP